MNAHKERERRFSITGVEDGMNEERTAELKIQAADMPVQMQKAAVQSTNHALKVFTTEKHIAESIKQDFDQLYQPTWHCIVGRNWGSCVTHSKASHVFYPGVSSINYLNNTRLNSIDIFNKINIFEIKTRFLLIASDSKT